MSFKETVGGPVMGRLGTVLATWLVTVGISGDYATDIAIGLMAVGAFAFDLVTASLQRRKLVEKAVDDATGNGPHSAP